MLQRPSMFVRSVSLLTLVLLRVQVSSATTALNSDGKLCKTIPGDSEWPSVDDWDAFNATIGGKLVTPFQLGRVCHNPDYDEVACNYIREQWVQPHLQFVFTLSLTRLTPPPRRVKVLQLVSKLMCGPSSVRHHHPPSWPRPWLMRAATRSRPAS